METLAEQFTSALTRIGIRGDQQARAVDAHTEIRAVLEASEQLRSWGVDTVLIGSYARHTAIHPGKDVDVFSKLAALGSDASPSAVFEEVALVIEGEYGERAHRQRRSVKVDFGPEFAVDVVPAVKLAYRWGIPSKDPTSWETERRWVETDPEKLGELTRQRNRTCEVSGQGAYVPLVKLIRQVREHHLGDLSPGGLYFELMTYWAFASPPSAGDGFAGIMAAVLRSIEAQLAQSGSSPLIDPVLERPFDPLPTSEEVASALATFKELANNAARALELDRCPAAALWRQIIGRNNRGWCFPLPDGCDEEGNEIAPIASVASRGSREPHAFG